MSGKGMAPRKGYNQAKYLANYDAIFRPQPTTKPKQLKTMKTNQPGLGQPTILPWHREAAKEIDDNPFTQEADELAAIIARHDPHAAELVHAKQEWAIRERNVVACEKEIATLRAQHAETLRLLERALYCISLNDDTGHVIPAHVDVVNAISAHLAAVKGTR